MEAEKDRSPRWNMSLVSIAMLEFSILALFVAFMVSVGVPFVPILMAVALVVMVFALVAMLS